MYKRILIMSILMIFITKMINAQVLESITLEQCYEWTNKNYPLVQQLDLIEKSKVFNLENAAKAYLPQLSLNGQATYQSEVTTLPISLPNVEIPTISKDQYKVYGEVYQPLTNRSMVKLKQESIKTTAAIERQEVVLDLYKLKDRINQVYFGILLIEGQIKQFDIMRNDLNTVLEQVNAAVENGTAVETNQLLLQAELMNLEQKIRETKANKLAFVAMLANFTGKEIEERTTFETPIDANLLKEINRPELGLFDLQNQVISLQSEQIKLKKIPNVGLFLQSGYGRPALNFLANDFEFYYIGGLKASWNLSNFYTSKNEEELLSVSKSKVSVQRQTFLLNVNLAMTQQRNEIVKYESLIETDKALIKIRKSIKETAAVQLNNGLISALDFISYINAENKAKQDLVLHQTQLLMAQYNLKTTSGN